MTHVDLPNQSKGGVAHQVHYLANALVDRGHDVTMFTFSPAYGEAHYKVHQLRRAGHPKLAAFVFALRLAQTDFSDFDVLHTNGDNYLLRGRQRQIRTFYGSARDEMLSAKSWRRRAYQGLIAGLERAGGRVAQVNVGISQATRERIPAVTRIVPCGVDVRRFEPGAKSPQPSILFVGTAGGRKRGAFLAEVFEREIKPLVPEAQLWTVADRDLVGEGIVNYGRVALEELTRLYRSAWVFCLPSTYEGFGVPYIEAMASGTAVVASPNPGAREVLQEGASGTVAPDAELGGAIARLLTDAAVRADFEARGLRRSEDFAWPAVAGAYERIYEQIGSRTGTAA